MKTRLLFSIFVFTAMSSYSQQWTYTNLTEPKCRMGAASLGTKAYFAGGDNFDFPLTLVEIYDVVEQTWSYGNLSVARSFPVGVSCGSKVFFAGGFTFNPNLVYDVVDIYDTISQEWTVQYLSEPRVFLSVVAQDGIVLFAGGLNIFTGEATNVVDIYDLETGEWDTAYLSQARGFMASAVINDKAFFAGGYDFDAVSNAVDIYNFTNNTWTTATLLQARDHADAAAVGDKILIASGMSSPIDPNSASPLIDVYDNSTGTWSWMDNFPHPRAFIDYTKTIGDKVYFVGGGNMDDAAGGWASSSNFIDIYDNSSGTWSVDLLTHDLCNHSVAAVVTPQTGYLVVAGGASFQLDSLFSRVEVYGDLLSGTGELAVGSQQFAVHCYPNPTAGSSQFTVRSSQEGHVTLKVYDVQGREIEVLVDENLPAGEHIVSFDMSGMPAGIYFYRLTTDDRRETTAGKLVKY
jgi:hypothetical protein